MIISVHAYYDYDKKSWMVSSLDENYPFIEEHNGTEDMFEDEILDGAESTASEYWPGSEYDIEITRWGF